VRIARITVAVACTAAAFLAVGANASPRPPALLGVDVAEWSVVPSQGAVPAGDVRLKLRNVGNESHEIVLVRTRVFAQDLPLQGDHARVSPLATVDLEPGERATVTVRLRHGSYLLLDNLPWHYWLGTRAAFSVR
jgi:uncharacterized cupredoxin-like copper-binding protein